MNRTLYRILCTLGLCVLFITSCKKEDLPASDVQQPHMLGAIVDKPESINKVPLLASASYHRNQYAELMLKGKPAPKGGGTDTSVNVIPQPNTLPASVSLTMPPVLNQGSEGSCVAFASVYVRSGEWFNKSGATTYSYASNIFSPEFIYNQIKVGDCSAGSSPTDALTLLQNKGVCTWDMMPYSYANGCSLMPTSAQTRDAANYKIRSSARVVNSDQAAIKTLLAQKRPLMITISVDQGFYYARTGFIWSSFSGSFYGGHALTLCGYDDSKNAYKVINSWGTGWGDAGYSWIDYNFFPNCSGYNVYVMNN